MNVLVLGSGGREHALAWRLSRDEGVERVCVAPGNPGMALDDKIQTFACELGDREGVLSLCSDIRPALVVVGPEGPLVEGIADELEGKNIPVYGPSAKAARLEGSKIFSKKFMEKHSIPTAPYKIYTSYSEALEGLRDWNLEEGVAIKTDVLAGGKGVVVAHDFDGARDALYDFMENPLSTIKSDRVLVEKKLWGKELSWFSLCDGDNFLPLGGVCDYKRVGERDTGPNTGGMGCYVPKGWPEKQIVDRINDEVVALVLEGMRAEGTPYRGTLFAGLMIDGDEINVLEFNVRFGDPETQTLLPLLEGNLTRTLIACGRGELGTLARESVTVSDKSAVHVVMASEGYPSIARGALNTGHPVHWEPDGGHEDAKVFFAGVKKDADKLLNSGGRVLGVTGLGANVMDAREMAYEALKGISFRGSHWRGDIADGVSG